MINNGTVLVASELDGISGSDSVPKMLGSSFRVLSVATEGAACLDCSPHSGIAATANI